MPNYVALKRLQVQELEPDGSPKLGGDGRPVIRECVPGDPVPEAEGWKNLDKFVRSGHVGLEGLGLTGPALAETLQRTRTRHPDQGRRPRRRKAATRRAEPAPAPEPEQAEEPASTEAEDVSPAEAAAEAEE